MVSMGAMKVRAILAVAMLLASVSTVYAQEEWQDTDWLSMIYGDNSPNLRSGSIINNTGSVGTSATNFSVTQTGGAAYSVQIKMPPGIAGMHPDIAICYNSQQGNGLAGWGCGIAGISMITLGVKDIYHDGCATGIRHDLSDAFYLDGQRLVEVERVAGRDSAVFVPEGNPYTRVVLHGLNGSLQSLTWFSVTDPDGMKYEYGHLNGQQTYYSAVGNAIKTHAWYITNAKSPSGNIIRYSYETSDNYSYPSYISYGYSPYFNYVRFSYEPRPDTIASYLENTPVKVGKRLSAVTTSSTVNGTEMVYRRYTLGYDDTTDGTTTKYSRLTTVTESNGNGYALNPVTLEWSFPSSFSTAPASAGVPLVASSTVERFTDLDILAADINGDGLSDFLQHVNADSLGSNGSYTKKNLYHLFLSSASANGSVTYALSPITLSLSLDYNDGKWVQYVNMPMTADIDGDGLQDIIFPVFGHTTNSGVIFNCILGKEIASGQLLYHKVFYTQQHSTAPPAFTACDFDNDAHADIALLEREGNNGSYDFHLYNGTSNDFGTGFHTTLSLSFDPQKLFAADFNGDGLSDIIAIGSNSYKIFWNTGGHLSSGTFASSSGVSGNTLKDAAMLQMGDFNGDGQPDFLSNAKDSSKWYMLSGSANGTFVQSLACEIDAFEISGTSKDDGLFACQVFDADGDGKSDAVISKAMFSHHHDLFSDYYRFEKTKTFWMLSNGTSFNQLSCSTSNRQEDAALGHFTAADTDGDGLVELIHYGYDCYDAVNADVDASLLLFSNSGHGPSTGRVVSFTDGLGAQTSIDYKFLTDISVYGKGNDTPQFPVINTMPALSVVSGTIESPLSVTSSYTYEGLKLHRQGRGLMGMTKTTINRLGTTTQNCVNSWHPHTFQPVAVTTTHLTGTSTMTESSASSLVLHNATGQYVPLQRHVVTTDYDGNTTTEDFVFDMNNGRNTSHVTSANDGKTVEEVFTYSLHGGRYLPVEVALTQTAGSQAAHQDVTMHAYGSWGQLTETVLHVGSSKELTTSYTYDPWGNVTSISTSGDDTETVTKTLEYDVTHRLVTRSVERGYIVTEYAYDTWGNVLSETDKTRSACPQTTTYTYDGWGNLTSETSPLGLMTSYSLGWGTSAAQRYYTLEETSGAPWVKTWYDMAGRQVRTESVGRKGVSVISWSALNNRGQLIHGECSEGSRVQAVTNFYDDRHRKSMCNALPGTNTFYTYANRTCTATSNGRSHTEVSDSRGNITQSTDPLSSVSYTYGSNGLPSSVTSEGNTVTMEYDDAGNQTQLDDPDAGTLTYTYDALGRIRTQTDGRGITTTNTYNGRGQLVQTNTGGIYTYFTYGTGTTDNGLLLSMSREGYSATYQYDAYGRTTQETRTYGQNVTRTISYTYDQLGRLATRTFPNQLTVTYQYDNYGFLNKMLAGSQQLYEVTAYNGLTLTEKLGPQQLTRTTTYDDLGQPLAVSLALGNTTLGLGSQSYTYDYATGNLTSRNINGLSQETFTYDNLDRLTGWSENGTPVASYTYGNNGNILAKGGVGEYSYGSSRPHAVTSIENAGGSVPVTSTDLFVSYDVAGKANLIEDYDNWAAMALDYGPDGNRWETSEGYFFGDYEERFTGNGSSQHTSYTYLDGGVLCVTSPTGARQFYYMQQDHLGSIFEIVDAGGSSVFTASYDPWGRQDIIRNSIGFYRGFTGHEMLNDFGLINMNGRLYDPISSRFLSPDNYVQSPWNSQNFNRYSYCLNNPLKYNDPDGDFFLTWSLSMDGFSVGLNFGVWGIGLNVGCGENGPSLGIYGEIGPRVGGTGFGSGATVSVSADYNFRNNKWTSTVSEGAYASYGVYNAGGSASQTWNWKDKEWTTGWNVGAGVGFGDYEAGMGINASYGSSGWSCGIGGYFDNHAWDSNPVYDPDKWNEKDIIDYNNCYSYALDDINNGNFHGLQPGEQGGKPIRTYQDVNLKYVLEASLSDGRVKKPTLLNKLGFGRKGYYSVYLVIDEGNDYHWYRQDKGGLWSQKHGRSYVTNVDGANHLIKNPAKANHNYGKRINYKDGGILLWVRK